MSTTVTLDPRAEAAAVPSNFAGKLKGDPALRDFGLMLGALTLARLASVYDPPGLEVRL